MTRKDYQLIAEQLSLLKLQFDNYISLYPMEAHKMAVDYIADGLEQENDRFDRDKFFKACGIED